MDESRKRAASTANAKNISSSLDDDFGNDFLSSWKLPKSGKDTIDFDVESVPKSSKKFSFENLDDFGLDGAFDKLSSFKMGMSDLDFSSPLKKVKHNSSNGNDLSEGKKETEKDNFSFSFDFNELGKFNLDAKLGIEENGMSRFTEKADPTLSEGNRDPQRGLSGKGTNITEDNKSKEQTQTQTQDACILRPTHLTSINPARMEQNKADMVSNDRHGENSNETCPTKAAVNKSSQNFPCNAVSSEDPTHSTATAVPENSKEAPAVDLSKVNIPRENNDNEQSVSSQSRNTSTVNPYISRRLVGHSDSQSDQNEVVEESASLNEGSHGTQCFRGTSMKLLKKTSCGTTNVEEGTSGPKNLSSSMQREIRNVKPRLLNETGSFSLLSKSANVKASRPPQVTPETTLNQLSGANNMIKKIYTHPTDLKREQKHAQPDKSKIASPKAYSKPALHVISTTSMNAKLGLEPLSAGNLPVLNAPSSTAHSTGHNILPGQALLKSSSASDIMQGTLSKDDKRPTISQLTGSGIAKVGIRSPKSDLVLEKESVEVNGSKGSPLTTSKIPNSFLQRKHALLNPSMMQKMPEESVPDPKAPTVLKRIMRSPDVRKSPQTVLELGNQTMLGSGTPKVRMDNAISSTMPCEMGDIADLELPALLENDGNVEKAEACRKQLEDICILLKRKHAEAKELAVRAIVNNNMMLMLNHPMFEEKICALQKFSNSLTSKKYLFEEISAIDAIQKDA